jgi:hypothetical protein
MKKTLFLIVIVWFGISCDRYPDPAYEILKQYSFGFQTASGQKFQAGEWVSDSIPFYAYNSSSTGQDSVKVIFKIVSGGGEITVSTTYTNSYGLAYTGWKLGTTSFEQKLRAISYDLSGNYLTSTDLVEYGFRTNAWDTCSLYPDGNIVGMIADTINKLTLMVAYNQIYKEGDAYYHWEPVNDPLLVSPRTINMDKNGIIYVSTWDGELVKSTDHGISWKTCTKPFPDRPYYFFVSLANDNSVWAFYFDYPTRFSKDGGITWTNAGSNLSSDGYGDVFRLKDGSLLFHGSNCCSLSRSFDDGITWTHITTPGYSLKLYVDDNDNVYIVTQEMGITIYRSTDFGTTFTKVYNVYPEWGTSMDNTFTMWGAYYYILIPGWGILKSYDLTNSASYTEYYHNTNLRNLFIDHNGVLIGKDWQSNTVYYRKNSE